MGSDVPSMSFGEAHGPVLVRFVDMGVYGTISNSRGNEKGSQEGDIFMWLSLTRSTCMHALLIS